jgi:hypothetical protein
MLWVGSSSAAGKYCDRDRSMSARVGSTCLGRGVSVLAHGSPQRGDSMTMGRRFMLCSPAVKAYGFCRFFN